MACAIDRATVCLTEVEPSPSSSVEAVLVCGAATVRRRRRRTRRPCPEATPVVSVV
jgi:hypothetical protein